MQNNYWDVKFSAFFENRGKWGKTCEQGSEWNENTVVFIQIGKRISNYIHTSFLMMIVY